jgi:pilus assembly protein FimV
MGRELDPANPMYQPGGQPAGSAHAGGTSAFSPGGTVAMVAQPVHVPAPAPSMDVDLDLDFSLDDEPIAATTPAVISASPPPPPAPARVEPTVAMKPQEPAPLNMDFSSATVALPVAKPPAAKPAEPRPKHLSLTKA